MAESNRSQVQSIGLINDAVERIDGITRINARMVADTSKESQALASEAASLTKLIARLKSQISTSSDAETPERRQAMAEIDRLFG